MDLKLEASAGSSLSVPSEDGDHVLTVTLPVDVTLIVTAAEGTDPTSLTITKDGTPVPATFSKGTAFAEKTPFTATLTGVTKDGLGTYTVKLGADSARLILKSGETESPPPAATTADQVLEVEPGVYDERFALATGVTTAVFAALIIVSAFVSLARFDLEAKQTVVTQGWITNTLAERVAGTGQLLALALGGLLLLAGAWQAALEVRGRLSVKIRAEGDSAARGLSPSDVGGAISKAIDSLRQARGTIATLAVGLIVVLGSLWSAAHVASSSHGPKPAPSISSSPTSSPEESGSPSPSSVAPETPSPSPSQP